MPRSFFAKFQNYVDKANNLSFQTAAPPLFTTAFLKGSGEVEVERSRRSLRSRGERHRCG